METGGTGTDQVIESRPDAEAPPAARKSHWKRWLFVGLAVFALLFAGCAAVVGLNSTARNTAIAFAHGATKINYIPSTGMDPTFPKGARIASSSHVGTVKRGDVVLFHEPSVSPSSTILVKRVIGLPGERIEFRDGDVFINGQELVEPYLYAQHSTQGDAVTVPPDQYFVMGDNRGNSSDSRVSGPIPRAAITHVVIRILSPPSAAGSVPGSSR